MNSRPGERNGAAKLEEWQVREIRARVASGTRQVVLADTFGVSPAAINRIVKRKAWGHLR